MNALHFLIGARVLTLFARGSNVRGILWGLARD